MISAICASLTFVGGVRILGLFRVYWLSRVCGVWGLQTVPLGRCRHVSAPITPRGHLAASLAELSASGPLLPEFLSGKPLGQVRHHEASHSPGGRSHTFPHVQILFNAIPANGPFLGAGDTEDEMPTDGMSPRETSQASAEESESARYRN